MTSINRDEWLSALKDAGLHQANDPQAVTIHEFAKMFEIKDNVARRQLAALESQGKAIKTSKRFTDSMGRAITTTAYRLHSPSGTPAAASNGAKSSGHAARAAGRARTSARRTLNSTPSKASR